MPNKSTRAKSTAAKPAEHIAEQPAEPAPRSWEYLARQLLTDAAYFLTPTNQDLANRITQFLAEGK